VSDPFQESIPSPDSTAPPGKVARPPARPVMIFDGDCGFCRFWIERWKHWTGGRVEFVPYQEPSVAARFPEVPVSDCETSVQLVTTDGRVRSAAEAVFQSLAGVFVLGWLIHVYQKFNWFRRSTEFAYRVVAERRMFFSRINRWLWGRSPELPQYQQTTSLLVRGVALIFLVTFISLWTQIHGLIGENGILPAGRFMQAADNYFEQNGVGIGRYGKLPTLGWLANGDAALHAYCLLGVLCSLLALAGRVPATALFGCWLVYLSLVGLGQDFLSFQWDALLLEAGLLAALLAPWQRRWPTTGALKPLLGILLTRWLLFRLMFESGAVKLLSGDFTWRNLTALQHHFETQPLPHGLSWYAHQLPAGVLKSATIAMFSIELVVPFLIFAPRRLRLFTCGALAALQFAIIATGNYGIFNWLTLVLCLALLDDRALRQLGEVFRKVLRLAAKLPAGNPESPTIPPIAARWERGRHSLLIAYAVVVVLIGLAQLDNLFGSRSSGRGPVSWLRAQVEPFRMVNTYGLFAMMTTRRPELIIEGSLDGVEWRPYVFHYKPGPLDRRPPFVPLHMPRLDWQLWFAALQEGNPPRWFGAFAQSLFERSPEVLALLANDPFPDQAPTFMRVLAFDYRFTNATMRRNSGQWWLATNRRHYVPVMRWENPSSAADPAR
jgi:lipase maturation factor 1